MFDDIQYEDTELHQPGRNLIAFRKVRPVEMPLRRTYPLEWVQLYSSGLNAYTNRDYSGAISLFERALAITLCPRYPEMLQVRALCYKRVSQREAALRQEDSVLLIDSLCEGAHKDLFLYELGVADTLRAEVQRHWLEQHCPWDLARLDPASGRKGR